MSDAGPQYHAYEYMIGSFHAYKHEITTMTYAIMLKRLVVGFGGKVIHKRTKRTVLLHASGFILSHISNTYIY